MSDPAIIYFGSPVPCLECDGTGCACCTGGVIEVLREIDAEDVRPVGRDPNQLEIVKP